MANMKSYADFVLGTLDALLVDCASEYPELAKEFRRDFIRLSSAIDQHGIYFAMDTMPAFRKHFDKCLDTKRLIPSGLLHFGVDQRGGTIPRLFRGLILRVFDRNGIIRNQPDIRSIAHIRQLLGVVRKMRLTTNFKNTANSVDEFYQVDSSVALPSLHWDDSDQFYSEAASFLSFEDLNPHPSYREPSLFDDDSDEAVLPSELLRTIQLTADIVSSQLGSFEPGAWRFRHGPGAVSDQRFGSNKYSFTHWPERLERVFPYDQYAIANWSMVDPLDPRNNPGPLFDKEVPAKLCAVPKVLSKPRLIACEPTCFQWAQQSIRDYFYDRTASTLFGRFVDFRRQDLNANAALRASIDGRLSTIDLSAASDRVSCWAVERLFRRIPSLLDALQATRSAYITQDICESSPKLYKLRKYSSMGNATTFPVQSLFFLVLCLGCVLYVRGQRPTLRNLRSIKGTEVRVFGDDIVIPTDCSGVLMEVIQALGLKVNTSKSFTEGNFRESCGTDAFQGYDITSANVLDLPERARPGSIVSSIQVHHNLCDKGYFATARFVQKMVEQEVAYAIQSVEHGSGSLGWSSIGNPGRILAASQRYNQDLHRREVRVLTLKVTQPRRPPEDNAGFLQYFTEARKVITSASSTLGTHTQYPKVKLGLGWVPA